MKKLIACILAIALLLSFAACNSTDAEPTQDVTTKPAPTEPKATDPAPTEPAPSEPAPSEPAPSEPAPSEPAPSEPAPADPAPADPTPIDPTAEWTFTDMGSYIAATSGDLTLQIPLDTSHIPESYETSTSIYTTKVYRYGFHSLNGWVVFHERYIVTSSPKVGYTGGSSITNVGHVFVKMDGSQQMIIQGLGTIVDYVDGYLYYVLFEGEIAFGEQEYQWLTKRTFDADGNMGEEIVICELENAHNELVGEFQIQDGWLYYSEINYKGDFICNCKIKLDGTEFQEIT